MRKIFIALVLLIISIFSIKADETQIYSLSFNESQFSFKDNGAGALEIVYTDSVFTVGYDTDTSEPGLPWLGVDVQLPSGSLYKSFKVSSLRKSLFNDIVVAENPLPTPTNQTITQTPTTALPQYAKSVYPSVNVKYVASSIRDQSVVLHFLVCPFVYEVTNRQLRLVNKLDLNITYATNGITTKEERCDLFFQHFPEASILGSVPTSDEDSIYSHGFPQLFNDSLDYILITSDALYDDFKPWVRWKTQKGVKARIVSVEDIESAFDGMLSTENAIKLLLATLYYKNGLKYALLAGDDTIVPAKKCYGRVGSGHEDNTIPTDLFYACLDYDDDNLFWDKNGNGICGEVSDNISMSQSIIVTRLPVRTSDDVKNVIRKLRAYERKPTANGWNNNMLTAGTRIGYVDSYTHSDAEQSGDKMYKTYIAPYWNGERKKFYDTYSDVDDAVVDKDGLQNQLTKGYSFVDVISHGGEDHWGLYYKYTEDSPASKYMTADAENQTNSGYTVVTTNACSTNAFDWQTEDPCMSEALLRNPDSGVIAYLGSSRLGWSSGTMVGNSQLYDALFYKNMFSPSQADRNFGRVVAETKARMTGQCGSNGVYRWLQFAVNPIGDPETPIYTTTPSKFTAYTIGYGKNTVNVNTGVDSCTVCVMSSKDDGATYYDVRRNVRKATFSNVATDVTVCISKQNYIPRVCSISKSSATSNMLRFVTYKTGLDEIDIETDLSPETSHGTIKVSSATGKTSKTYTVSADSPNLTVDTSTFEKGIYVVSLYVNGQLADSKSIVIQ